MLLPGKDFEDRPLPDPAVMQSLIDSRVIRKKLEPQEISDQEKQVITKPDSATRVQMILEPANPEESIDTATMLIATMVGGRQDILDIVNLIIVALQQFGGGVSDLKLFKEVDDA